MALSVHCTLSLKDMAISEEVTAVDYNSLREFHAFRNYFQNSGNFETGEKSPSRKSSTSEHTGHKKWNSCIFIKPFVFSSI